jgi:hypothetical protein
LRPSFVALTDVCVAKEIPCVAKLRNWTEARISRMQTLERSLPCTMGQTTPSHLYLSMEGEVDVTVATLHAELPSMEQISG